MKDLLPDETEKISSLTSAAEQNANVLEMLVKGQQFIDYQVLY